MRGSFRNRLLARLDQADVARLAPLMSRVALPQRTLLMSAGEAMDRCYFLESGVASVLVSTVDGRQTEIGLIGHEGMVNVGAVMSGVPTPLEVFIEMPGEALVVATSDVMALFDDSRAFRRLLLGYAHSFLIQVSQTALASVTLKIEDRLARRLLMTSDRTGTATFPITHEFLSLMLGVRRAGVTDALGSLVAAGCIATARGQITIVDRKLLEQRAGESYGVSEANYRRLVEE